MRVEVRRQALATDIPRRRGQCYDSVRFAALAAQFSSGHLSSEFGAAMSEVSDTPFGDVLDPMERITETLFGLIMALTSSARSGSRQEPASIFKQC